MAGFKRPVKDTETDTQPVYNVLEEPYLKASQGLGHCGATSAEGPVDNTLEEPVNDKGNNTQLVYNVLEGPYLESAEEPSHYGALPIKGPVYNTLEGPANNIENDTQTMYISSTCSAKEPFYNTLERPVQSNDNDTQPVIREISSMWCSTGNYFRPSFILIVYKRSTQLSMSLATENVC